MKKVLAVLAALCFIGAAQADLVVNGIDPGAAWSGWMNVFETPANGGTYLWGSPWGTADLRANFVGGNLLLQSNTNCWNPADPYWVTPEGAANKDMEANFYLEFDDMSGTVTFNFEVLANNLDAGYQAVAFVKLLDKGSGDWSLDQFVTEDLTVGSHSLVVPLISLPGNSTQVGFLVRGLVSDPAGPAAATAVTIVPEPISLVFLGLGGLLLRRKK